MEGPGMFLIQDRLAAALFLAITSAPDDFEEAEATAHAIMAGLITELGSEEAYRQALKAEAISDLALATLFRGGQVSMSLEAQG